jgi:hypothetical protein
VAWFIRIKIWKQLRHSSAREWISGCCSSIQQNVTSSKKEQPDIAITMNELQLYYAEWKKLDLKRLPIVRFHLYVEVPRYSVCVCVCVCVCVVLSTSTTELYPQPWSTDFFFFFLVGLGFELRALCLQRALQFQPHLQPKYWFFFICWSDCE